MKKLMDSFLNHVYSRNLHLLTLAFWSALGAWSNVQSQYYGVAVFTGLMTFYFLALAILRELDRLQCGGNSTQINLNCGNQKGAD